MIRNLEGSKEVFQQLIEDAKENLRWLDLQHNYLVELSSELSNFSNLKCLYLHCNYIKDINNS